VAAVSIPQLYAQGRGDLRQPPISAHAAAAQAAAADESFLLVFCFGCIFVVPTPNSSGSLSHWSKMHPNTTEILFQRWNDAMMWVCFRQLFELPSFFALRCRERLRCCCGASGDAAVVWYAPRCGSDTCDSRCSAFFFADLWIYIRAPVEALRAALFRVLEARLAPAAISPPRFAKVGVRVMAASSIVARIKCWLDFVSSLSPLYFCSAGTSSATRLRSGNNSHRQHVTCHVPASRIDHSAAGRCAGGLLFSRPCCCCCSASPTRRRCGRSLRKLRNYGHVPA